MKYTKELLAEILQEGGAVVLEEYEKYNQRMHIKFRCKCGKEDEKKFEMLNVYRSPYCDECSRKINIERRNHTWMTKYSVSNISNHQETKEKIQKSYIEKYGDHPKRTKEVQEKWKKTCLDKYGGHPNQNPDIQAKAEINAFQYKEYTLPSGKVVKIQGYEDAALNELLDNFDEEDIILGKGNVPRIPYMCNEGVNRIYFPDFFIESMNTILEIKSDWTLKLKTCRLDEKAKAVKQKGYEFEVWVYDANKKNKRILKF